MILRSEVNRFAKLMERKLRANDHKGGWERETTAYLSRRLGQELKELRGAVARLNGSTDPTPEQVATVGKEAADVANFAMMIADVCGALTPPQDGG